MYKYNVFISKITENIKDINYNNYSNYRLDKIKATSSKKEVMLNIQIEKLLLFGLRKYKKDLIKCPKIYLSKQGKPYFKDLNIYFNISHSNNYIAIGIGYDELGIDIEKIDNNRLKIANKILNNNELELFNNNVNHLIKTWTIKEAYIKLFALSVLINLRNINIENDEINSKYGKAYYKSFKFDNYYLTVASKKRAKIIIQHVVF